MYRVEATQPGVVDAARKYGAIVVNGFSFAPLEDGRVVTTTRVPEEMVSAFDVPGYILVRDEPPYERVKELGRSVAIAELDQALREGTLPAEAVDAAANPGEATEPGAGENPEGTSRPRRKR